MTTLFFSSFVWRRLTVLSGLLLLASGAQAQQNQTAPDSLARIGRRFEQHSRQTLTEKLYLHLDRGTYAVGETMWFSIYAADGTLHQPLPMSKVAYVEVLSETNQSVLRAKVALQKAGGQGSFVLPPELPSGRYVVRAYTSWMQNFSPDFYFHCPVTILNTTRSAGATARRVNEQAAPDVQFFPEGGQLVQGLPGRVAFKVLDATGRSLAATGTVADSRGQTVATFATLKFGLGSFLIIPTLAGEAYTATLRLANNTIVTAKLPAVAAQGYALRLTETTPTTLTLMVQTNLPAARNAPVYLLAHAGQQVALSTTGTLTNGQTSFTVDKRILKPGISHFTVFTSRQEPVCERLYFKAPPRQLPLTVEPATQSVGTREKVLLRLSTGSAARVSVAVYQLDSLSAVGTPNIASYLSLTSELKGTVERPDYYLRDSSAVGQAAADHLMLTHGWSRFRWSEVLAGSPALPHLPELNGHLLQVRLTRTTTGAPVPGVSTYLSAPSRTGQFYHGRSQADGVARLEMHEFTGFREFILQTNSLQDSLLRPEIVSPYSLRYAAARPLQPGITAQLQAPITERHLQQQVQRAYTTRLANLALLPPPDTISFFGRPDERYLLDDYTRFPTMEEVLREYVPGVLVRKRKDGFHFLVLDRPGQKVFADNPLVLLDGVPLFDMNKVMALDPIKIRALDVLTRHYYQGSQAHQGLLSLTTYKGDMGGLPLPERALLEQYEGLQAQRTFYAPRYETAAQQQSRQPDLRSLLYWNASLDLTAGQSLPLDFYASDQPGSYLIVVQGLGNNGQAATAQAILQIKAAQ